MEMVKCRYFMKFQLFGDQFLQNKLLQKCYISCYLSYKFANFVFASLLNNALCMEIPGTMNESEKYLQLWSTTGSAIASYEFLKAFIGTSIVYSTYCDF